MTTCEKAGLNYNCIYCSFKKHNPAYNGEWNCFVLQFYRFLEEYITANPKRFKECLYKTILYNKGRVDTYNNPSNDYVIGAVKLYFPEYMDYLNKMLVLL